MGREHDLLDAARTGNCSVIEKIVAQRHKRMGQLPLALQAPLASLTRRTLNINCQDSNGDTPLHLAALNGHMEAVRLLLQHEGSANMDDSRGCFPLHLAAWNGHADICRVLLTHGPSIAKVNEQNAIVETALHCAAQYGHDKVVSVLLEYHANPNIRNHHNESPLDLACQYGRLETAQQLLRRHPTLPCHNIDKHSPLHLAARNGHRQVAQLLLDAGFDINTRMETGTALHEAAIFGKGDVVRLLLDNGIDTSLTDAEGRTALEVLSEHRSQISLDIGNIILDHTEGIDTLYRRSSYLSNSSCAVYDTVSLQEPLTSLRYRDNKVTSATSPDVFELYSQVVRQDRVRPTYSSKESVSSAGSSMHEVPPVPPKLCDARIEEPIYDTPMPVSMATRSALASIPKPRLLLPSSALSGSTNSLPHSPTDSTRGVTPKKPPRRHLPSPRGGGGKSVNGSPPQLRVVDHCVRPSPTKAETFPDRPGNIAMVAHPADTEGGCSVDERRSQSAGSRTGSERSESERTESESSDTGLKYRASVRVQVGGSQPLMTTTSTSRTEKILNVPVERVQATCEVCEDGTEYYVSEKTPPAEGEQKTVGGSLRDKTSRDTKEAATSSRPPSLEFSSHRTRDFPLSPTGYMQPPTPDHPPPSPSRAACDIQEQINPGEKRRSKDMETITEAELLSQSATPAPRPWEHRAPDSTSGLLQLLRDHTGRRSTNSQGDAIEIVANENNPFLGLCKGSIPLDERRPKSTLYENVLIQQRRRESAPGQCATFDPVAEEGVDPQDGTSDVKKEAVKMRSISRMSERKVKSDLDQNRNCASTLQKGEDGGEHPLDETEEWAKIADIMASFGGGITRESLFLDLLERDFRALLTAAVDRTRQDGPMMQSVGDWLDSLGLPQYENTLVANGFDDMDFMGPNVLDRNDLLELNITDPDHQDRILRAAAKVPKVKSIAEDHAPTSVEEWLSTLRLSDYLDTFQRNNFTTVDKVRNVWELELNSVLDAVTLGHRKRILASLSIPPSEVGGANGGRDPTDRRRTVKWSFSLCERRNVESLDLFKDYTKRPEGQEKDGESGAGATDDSTGQLPHRTQDPNVDISHCEDISLRPPQGGDGEIGGVRQWRHKPEVLVKGCCNYSAQYLGSALVKQLQGVESTKDAINKMKKSSSNVGKVPVIILSISYQGVKFIDAKSKRVICEHAVSNIFCACQDGDNLNYFAYITKDLMSDRHYCHVFNVKSTDMATEIILTLGEAFEVAYQIALRSQTTAEQGANRAQGDTVSAKGDSDHAQGKTDLAQGERAATETGDGAEMRPYRESTF